MRFRRGLKLQKTRLKGDGKNAILLDLTFSTLGILTFRIVMKNNNQSNFKRVCFKHHTELTVNLCKREKNADETENTRGSEKTDPF